MAVARSKEQTIAHVTGHILGIDEATRSCGQRSWPLVNCMAVVRRKLIPI